MTISVNSNRSALNALQTLARGNDPLAASQTRPGAKAGEGRERSAPAVQAPRADAGSLIATKRSLDRAASVSDVALASAGTVSSLIETLRQLAAEAAGAATEPATRQRLDTDFRAGLRQIDRVVQHASFDGANLLNGSTAGDLRFSLDAQTQLSLSAYDLTLGGPVVRVGAETGLGSADEAAVASAALEASHTNVASVLEGLGAQSRQVEAHTRFVSRLRDAAGAGESGQVEAGLSKEGARLQALHVQQQLSGQRLSIANQAPQIVLQLFRA
jgi:flagellin